MRTERRTLSASTLAGEGVFNESGEQLGTVEEIMIDVHTGSVAYAVLSFAGLRGFSDKLVAIPWERLRSGCSVRCLVLDVEKEALERAPRFHRDDWPHVDTNYLATIYYITTIYSYYGVQPYWRRWARTNGS